MTPLHDAVIEGDEETTKHLRATWQNARDELGFIPLELAQFLGQYRCAELLGGKFPEAFKARYRSEKTLKHVSLENFEKAFDITYAPFLRFESYQSLRQTIENCPYILRSHWLAKENYEWTDRFHEELRNGTTAQLSIRWIDHRLGYGAFADADISSGEYVGEYTGMVRPISRKHPDQNAYCFHYPTRFWSLKYFVVDGLHCGNLMRFVNHSDRPNLQPLCLVDRGLLHLVFVAKEHIPKGTQLTFDYGQDYWIRRQKIDL